MAAVTQIIFSSYFLNTVKVLSPQTTCGCPRDYQLQLVNCQMAEGVCTDCRGNESNPRYTYIPVQPNTWLCKMGTIKITNELNFTYNYLLLWIILSILWSTAQGFFFVCFFSERQSEGTQSRKTNTGGLPGKTEGCLWPLLVGTWIRHG